MIDVAIKHEDRLKQLFLDVWHDEHYKFWMSGGWCNGYESRKDTWGGHQFVSINSSGDIIGYIGYNIDRNAQNISSLSALNFTENKIIFGRDLFKVVTDIFDKYHFRKIEFSVVCGNPIEKSYDKLCERFGGRIVGKQRDSCRLIDGKYYDLKLYEIFESDYINKKANKI